MPDTSPLRIAIIGAGVSGIAAGRELLRKGFTQFTIFDALDAPGGTWQLHSYPGLACDVWAHSYTYSYAPNPDWSASFVDQPEIQAYLARCATDFGLEPHLRLNTRILSAHYSEPGTWTLRTSTGEEFVFDIVINAMGNQHTPLFPDVPGRDLFQGPSWHGTRWNHAVELHGKRVAIVGSAASAVQIVPEVAKVAGHLTVLQRSANWIMPRGIGSTKPLPDRSHPCRGGSNQGPAREFPLPAAPHRRRAMAFAVRTIPCFCPHRACAQLGSLPIPDRSLPAHDSHTVRARGSCTHRRPRRRRAA
jgi:cation diffusion facilitator CzcD-associated flavoprotein CzcO